MRRSQDKIKKEKTKIDKAENVLGLNNSLDQAIYWLRNICDWELNNSEAYQVWINRGVFATSSIDIYTSRNEVIFFRDELTIIHGKLAAT